MITSNQQQQQKIQLKSEQRAWKDILPRKICEWPINLERCLVLGIIREMQVKIRMR
jgi:hypothetical protein